MGKIYKHLYKQVYEFENLWYAARKARRGKRQKADVLEFEFNLEDRLFSIQTLLAEGKYTFSPYSFFTIYEPQERDIAAAPYQDRVVHHAVCNIIEPILDSLMIFDSYACRLNKGSHRAIKRAHSFLEASNWVLKLDIKKYFFTIDQAILLADLQKKIKDEHLLSLIKQILDTYQSGPEYSYIFAQENQPDLQRRKGLPIGNLTSQLFANFFLTPLDRFIKETLKVKHYLRYMDDALLFANSKEQLGNWKIEINHFLESRRLKLHEKKSQLFPAKMGVRFLGFHIYRERLKIQRANLIRFKKRMKQNSWLYRNADIDWNHILMSLNGWLGFAESTKNTLFKNQLLSHVKFKHPEQDEEFSFFIPVE